MSKIYKVIQISDSHLLKDKNDLLLGYNPYENLKKVISHVQEHNNNMDSIIMTGDISGDGSIESYHHFLALIKPLQSKVCWIPGNHDSSHIYKILTESFFISSHKNIILGSWNLLLLDTRVAKEKYGIISKEQFDFVTEALNLNHDRNIAIALHHHPIKIDSPLIDHCMLQNSDALLAFIKKHKNVKLMICGHVHNFYSLQQECFVLQSGVASCFQFKPHMTEIETEDKQGYTEYLFHDNQFFSKEIYI